MTMPGMKTRLFSALLSLFGTAALAENGGPCRDLIFDGLSFSVCEAGAADDVRLFHTAEDGLPFGSFSRVDLSLAAEGKRLAFAMNAGMYHPDRTPVGLLIENGAARGRLITAEGPGNFGLLPNGVFCADARFAVIESRRFRDETPDCRHATQSGPMLVIGGELHPRFLVDASSRHFRNGVGVSADGQRAVFAISNSRVTFHEFGRLFRDGLGLPDALYLDGSVSRLHAPGLGRTDLGLPMGPIVGLAVPQG